MMSEIGPFFTGFGRNLLETNIVMQSMERVMALRSAPAEESRAVKERYIEPRTSWPELGEIEYQNYDFRYGEGLPCVLHGINVKIESEEKVRIIGRTGSGKSTMMAGLFGIVEPAGGRIIVDGVDITAVPLGVLRRRLCILPQEATLFSGTVRENLDQTQEARDDAMEKALKDVDMNCKLDDVVTENGENYSLGERQKISMARVILRGSKVLVMDEATVSMDVNTDAEIQSVVRRNFKGCTVLTIAHRLESVTDASRILLVEGGRVKEVETISSLVEKGSNIGE